MSITPLLHLVHKEFVYVKEPKVSRSIVKWEGMMKVVISFSKSEERHERVFYWKNLWIVRFVTEHVSSTVDEPCCMKGDSLSKDIANEECPHNRFIPKIDRNKNRKTKCEDSIYPVVMPHLEIDERIIFEVIEVEFGSFD
jgi:hypothetical protein